MAHDKAAQKAAPAKAVRTRRSRAQKDPEGRMSLGNHMRELRNRLFWCAGAVVITGIAGWFLFPWVFSQISEPFSAYAAQTGKQVQLNYGSLGDTLNIRLQVSAYIGLILAMPMFLYQAWMFIMPGLHRNERRYALGFFGTAIPLFAVGCTAGFIMMRMAIPIFMELVPDGASNIVNFKDYLRLVIKAMLAFGLAFIMPVVLVVLNFMGILSGRAMLKAWRWVVFLCFAFTAVMVPTPEPTTMIVMTIPMIALYFIAVGIAFWHDRRAAKNADTDIPDDQASSIDDEPEPIAPPSRSVEGDLR
ncbi:twin-arginine translocase subunit TatC [Brachybacterium sp. JHP9]|uniref:Sec-independent protein translocase protein TatC n=1 Tax=Brachybacterium equifaecis TaxID=2910770 RepID=A0ABT0R2J6_9MICO|nr:twin-arginine translocase subunit TatC [Brachybacterium equifaecis]